MKKQSIMLGMAALWFVCSAAAVFAQTGDFSGTWVIKERKILSGIDYGNAVPKQIKVTQKADSIMFEKVSMGANGEDVTTLDKMSFAGISLDTLRADKRRKKMSVKLSEDKQSLTVSTTYSSPDNANDVAIKIADVWSLSNAGKVLKMTRTFESTTDKNDQWSAEGTYAKE